MIGLGTIINTGAILLGGLIGLFCRKALKESVQNTLIMACGLCSMFLGIGGTLEEMLIIENGKLNSQGALMMVICLALGSLLGELLDIERRFEQFGVWLKQKTKNENNKTFVDAFVTASLTTCIGAMAIVGAIQDGIFGDYTILATKAVLDLVIILIMTASMGIGCIFAAIPVAVFQGVITLLARLIEPLMTEQALSNLSLTGSMLIFCVGVNLVWGKKIKVANMLPSVIFAVIWAFLPFA